jgi:hypothetical protein
MIIIGLVLLIAAAGFGLDLVWKNQYSVRSPELFGQTLGIHNAAVFFVIGAITGAALLLGFALLLAGLRRKGSKARQRRQDRREARNASLERDRAQEENEKLRRQLEQDDTGTSPSDATAAGAPASSDATAAEAPASSDASAEAPVHSGAAAAEAPAAMAD